jgi:hypothetical protein
MKVFMKNVKIFLSFIKYKDIIKNVLQGMVEKSEEGNIMYVS